MKRKIIGITLMLILISSSLSLSVEGGSEKNPEIEDETGECHNTIDIESVWFFENPDEPEYLYIKMKLANFKIFRISQGFHVNFRINNESFQVSLLKEFLLLSFYELTHEIRNGSQYKYEYYNIYGQTNKIDNTIIWKIPKELIGNPLEGDYVNNISAVTIDLMYFVSRAGIFWIILQNFNIDFWDLYSSGIPILKKFCYYTLEIFEHSADFAESNDKDYIIQY